MTPKTPANFRIDDTLLRAMAGIRTREGIPISEQLRRGIRLWLKSKGVVEQAAPRRARTRRKA